MTKIERTLLQVRHVRTFLDSAEAALTSAGSEDGCIDAAKIVIEEAERPFADLAGMVSGRSQSA